MGFGGDEQDDEIRGGPDDDGPELLHGALPDRLDRVWLHPSELSPLSVASATRTRPMWTTTLVAGAAGAILTLAVLGAIGALGRPSDHVSDPPVVPTLAPIASAQAVAISVADSVVAVSARDASGTRRGSGVYVRKPGEILTSDRLVGDATAVDITTADGVVHRARILGRDSTTDLVLLQLEAGPSTPPAPGAQPAVTQGPTQVVPAPLATSPLEAGDTVWIVGAPDPGDSSPWMSSGMVASTDGLVAVASGPTTSGLLETAAASSSAASGGALVNRAGAVTGIVLSPVGDDRMTYAVPIATALAIANDLRIHGYTEHGALGINGIDAPAGPTVTSVIAGGPAARAGVRVGDVLEAVDNHEVYSMDDVMALVRHDQPGQPVVVELLRGSHTMSVSAKLTSMVSP